jgi:hypothetical protein
MLLLWFPSVPPHPVAAQVFFAILLTGLLVWAWRQWKLIDRQHQERMATIDRNHQARLAELQRHGEKLNQLDYELQEHLVRVRLHQWHRPATREQIQAAADLGIGVNATSKEVRAAFRTLVKTCHPDLVAPDAQVTATETFRRITTAQRIMLARATTTGTRLN